MLLGGKSLGSARHWQPVLRMYITPLITSRIATRLLQMAVISRAEGPWEVPAEGSILSDGKVAVFALVLYAVIAGIHDWLDHPAIVFL